MSFTADKNAELCVLPVLRQLADIPAAEWAYFARRLTWLELAPAEALSEAGVVADRLGFVARGLIRKLHLSERGKRVVRGFGGPGSVVGAYASLLTRQPSHLRVEALEPTGLFVLHWSEIDALYARHVCWQIVGRRLAEANLVERELRAHELLTASATERYRRFCETHRELLPRLRDYDIASYLGITPVSLSRLRARRRFSSSGSAPASADTARRRAR
jgi:CRP-like cAMP-binding protein